MPDQAETARHFLALHERDTPLLLPNPWDAGSAKLLERLGFAALATTSSGFAAASTHGWSSFLVRHWIVLPVQ